MEHTLQLSELLDGFTEVDMNGDCIVSSITIDSRSVVSGSLFLAMPGVSTDGRQFIAHADRQGAAAVLYEATDEFMPPDISVPMYPVSDLTAVAGQIADRFYDSPSRKLTVIGVTGTNGKTTCTQLLAQVLDAPDRRCAIIGTLGNGFVDSLDTTVHTTPDVITVHALMAKFVTAGAGCVCIEVSSHALEQGRINGVSFDIAVFTNLSRDHLDYHCDMESYAAAKASLFTIPGIKVAVINQEDDFGRELLSTLDDNIRAISFGLEQGDYHTRIIVADIDGLQMKTATPYGGVSIRTELFGRFNAANLLAVLAAVVACGLSLDEAAKRLAQVKPVTGRMERFGGRNHSPLVVVDYAHTPDALEKVLQALREHTAQTLWCVFGCGGDRDRGKRPQMGRVAEELADKVVITDDNPRHEDPDQIVNDIRSGMSVEAKVIHRRAQAISEVIESASEGDIVLLAGKGHEDYQQIGDERIHFSDREVVTEVLGEAA
jgi:UDP-N-acetylmuramoyl-L-alanyl-D-glutamate--2,6-diaminopimelate ligase